MGLGITPADISISADDVRYRFAGREYELIGDYLGPPNERLSNWTEWRWGSRGSFKLTANGPDAGLWFDYESWEGGDLFTFVQREENCTFPEALRIVANFYGVTAPLRVRPRPKRPAAPSTNIEKIIEDARAEEERTRKACELWEQCLPIFGTLAEKYLREVRGYELPKFACDVLRFHPACRWGAGTAPALVAHVDDIISDELIGIHRTALDASGQKIGRRYLGVVAGGAIKLWPASEVRDGLCIGEGLETSLAGYALLGLKPIWSLLDAGHIGNFPLVPGVEQLHVLVDHDGAGEEAAAKVQRLYEAARRTVELIKPDQPGDDMDDEWNAARRRSA